MFQHIVFNVNAATLFVVDEIDAVQIQDISVVNEVRAGAVIKAIYIESWITSQSASAAASFTIVVEKIKGGQPDMTFAQSQNLENYPNKANILYTTQGLIGANINNAVPILKQWIAIPKGKQRFALGDKLHVNYVSITNGISICGVTIYKEYY